MGPTTTRHVAELVAAAPLALHAPPLRRTDCNSPVHVHGGRLFAFVSRHEPRGHAYRRVAPARGGVGDDGLRALGAPVPVRIVDDPDPAVGKWIESTWRDARGRLHGWYHAEEPAPAPARLFVPHIGALASDDDGATWRCLGEALRAPAGLVDTGAANGFMAGGYGDFSVVADREARFLYIHFSSYVADERAQGVAVARYPVAARDAPAGAVEIWRDGGWRPARGTLPTPLWPVARGWRHADPDSFWGPAVHFNRDLGAHVMLLGHVAGPHPGFHAAGVAVSFNADLARPDGWSAPERIAEGGGWYPQVVGLGPEDGDTVAGAEARFLIGGLSAWHIRFRRATGDADRPPPPRLDRAAMIELARSLSPGGA